MLLPPLSRLKPRQLPWACASALPLLLVLTGCAVTAVDPPAPTAAPAQFKETGLWQRAAGAQAAAVPDDWWKLFNDPVLNDLEGKLVVGNENLKGAIAQVAQARATLDASRASLWPTLGAGLSATRSASPTGSVPNSPNASNGPNESVSLTANASWEIDLWGRLAQASNASEARLQASVDDLASARLSAQALLAQSYFSMRTFEAQQALYERNLDAYTRSLTLTQARYDAGVVGRTDVLQAQTQLKNAQAQLADAMAQRAQTEHAIAVLLGQAPSSFAIARTAALPDTPSVPVLLPSTLLQRRPDIAAAERRVAAAYSQIGAADAAFFPSLSLSASAGYRGSSLANLISAPNFLWSIGPALAQTLFDGGARKAASAQARASADQATATYRQTVLTALQEVEDNLAVADQLRSAAQLQREALALAQTNLTITTDQYREGTVSYLNVVSAQTAALSSELSLLSVRNRELNAVNQLLKNIAGRWQQ
jgi:NodT family efflux transporter outer membrane factor (OMF) lipoprotein